MATPLIDPGSFLSLINLQHLEIVNHDGNESYSRYKNVDISYDIVITRGRKGRIKETDFERTKIYT